MAQAKAGHGAMYGEVGVLAEDGDCLQCHLCEQWYRSLAAHLVQGHDLTAHQYRAAFGLGVTTALVGSSLRAVRRQTGLRVLTQYTEMREYIATLSPEVRSAAAKGREVRLETRRRLSAAKRRQVVLQCAICGAAFEIKASRARRPERHTCSSPCRRALHRQDAQRSSHRSTTLTNLAEGRATRWTREKAVMAERLRALDPSAFALLSAQDGIIVRAYYGLDGDGHVTQQALAQQCGLTFDQIRGRLRRSLVTLLGP